jgi:integrase
MATIKVLMRKYQQKSDGSFPIVIRVTENRKSKFIVITHLHEKNWDQKNSRVKSNHKNSARLNNMIQTKLSEVNDIVFKAQTTNHIVSSREIKNVISGKATNSFFSKGDDFIEELKNSGKHNQASSYDGQLNGIKEFNNNIDIEFHHINQDFLRRFKVYLLVKRGVSERTTMNYYVLIRTLFNRAIADGLDSKYYPFGKGKTIIRFPESIKLGLEKHEILALEKLKLEELRLIHTRNVFLFSFYLAGIRVSDILRMEWKDIVNNRLIYSMGKNKKSVSLQIPEKALNIIKFYKEDKKNQSGFIFPELKKANLNDSKDIHVKIKTATKKFNKYLSQLAKKAEIKKKITMHIARHSFGNIAGDNISPQMLQKLYRHSSITTTMGYQGNFIHKDTDNALDSVIDF